MGRWIRRIRGNCFAKRRQGVGVIEVVTEFERPGTKPPRFSRTIAGHAGRYLCLKPWRRRHQREDDGKRAQASIHMDRHYGSGGLSVVSGG